MLSMWFCSWNQQRTFCIDFLEVRVVQCTAQQEFLFILLYFYIHIFMFLKCGKSSVVKKYFWGSLDIGVPLYLLFLCLNFLLIYKHVKSINWVICALISLHINSTKPYKNLYNIRKEKKFPSLGDPLLFPFPSRKNSMSLSSNQCLRVQ